MAGKAASYSINAQDKTKQGIQSAVSGLEGLNRSLSSMGTALKAAFSVYAIKKAVDGVGELQKAFGVQLSSEIKLQQAVKNNPLLNGQSAKKLKEYASSLQGASTYGDELIIAQEAMLASQGRSEDQIKSIMQASIDLAASGVMPLDGAVKNMAKTYSGLAGELGESIPALKELTAEQMKSGEAVALIGKQYQGMAAAAAAGVEGTRTQAANLKVDIMETLGELSYNILGDTNKKLLPLLNGINQWLNNNKTQIVNAFKSIPQIAATSFNLIKGVISQVFTPEFWTTWGSIAWELFLDIGSASIMALFGFIKAIGTTLWEPLKYGFEIVTTGIKNGFAAMINYFIDKMNFFISKYNELANSWAGQKIGMESADLLGRMNSSAQKPENNIKENITEAWNDAFKGLKREVPKITEGFIDAWSEVTESAPALFGDEFDAFLDNTAAILNEPLTLDFKDSALSDAGSAGALVPSGTGSAAASSAASSSSGFLSSLSAAFSELSAAAGGVIDPLMSMFTSITSVNALLNWQATIMEAIIETIAIPLNEILSPLVGILRVLGQIIGNELLMFIQLLTPAVQIVSYAFLALYNYAIRPFGNMMIFLMTTLQNAVANIINAIMSALDHIPFVDVDYRMSKMKFDDYKMDKISYSDLENEGESYISSTGGSTGYETTGSASYTQAKDVYITINMDYQVGLSAFDDNDIAVKINDSLKRAQDLGYI